MWWKKIKNVAIKFDEHIYAAIFFYKRSFVIYSTNQMTMTELKNKEEYKIWLVEMKLRKLRDVLSENLFTGRRGFRMLW